MTRDEDTVQPGQENLWVRKAQAGDRQAFSCLVDLYWERMFRWLCGLTGQGPAAEDLTQETFLKAWTGLPSLKDPTLFRSWLFSIARNCWVSGHRGQKHLPAQRLPDAVAASDAGPVEQLLTQEGRSLLEAACAKLDTIFRAPFLLWTHEDVSFAEIGRILGITEETARWRVCKARRLLLKQLHAYLDEATP